MVREEFLGPSAQLVAGTAVLRDLLDGIAVADPPKVGAPDVGRDAGEGPATGGDLADEGVVVGFSWGASAGSGADGLQAGRGEGGVEGDRGGVAWLEKRGGGGSSVGVFGLHEDEGHGGFGPVGFDEEGKGAIVAAKERVGEELGLEVVE